MRKFLKFKRRWLQLLQIPELETHVGTFLKHWKFCLYIHNTFFLLIFVTKNKRLFTTNYQIHSVHTRSKTNLHPPIANLTKFQKGVYYSGIKIFNNLPHNIKELVNETKLFRKVLKRFLLSNSFYNSEEYFSYQKWPHDIWLKVGNILLLLKDMQVLASFFFLWCFINYV